MLRSPNSVRGQHQSTSSIYNYKTFNPTLMRPTSAKVSHQLSKSDNHESSKHNESFKTTLTDQHELRPLSRVLTNNSLHELIIEGKWEFRGDESEHSKFKSVGIENLVYICHDIMNKTLEKVKMNQRRQRTLSPIGKSWPLVNLDSFQNLTDFDRANLSRAHTLYLMTIVFEAVSTNTSICHPNPTHIHTTPSRHVRYENCSSKSNEHPKISYETAFRHLIHTPDNQLLQIALHASLITGHSRMDLQQLGEKLGVKRSHFDMGSIKDSTETFQDLIKLLREQKLNREREQQTVDTNRLPYKPKKKRGLNANVSGTKFAVGKLFLFLLSYFKFCLVY